MTAEAVTEPAGLSDATTAGKERRAGSPAGGVLAAARRLLRYAGGSKLLLGIALVLLTGNLVFDVGVAVIQERFIDTINGSNLAALRQLTLYCGIGSLVLTAGFMAQYYARNLAATRMTGTLAGELYAKTGKLPFGVIQRMHSGDLVSRNSKDTGLAVNLVGSVLFDMGYNLLLCLVAFVYLVRLNFWLALVALLAGPLVFFCGRFFDGRLRRLAQEILRKEAEVRGLLQEILQGVQVVRVFGMEDALVDRYVQERNRLNVMLRRRAVMNGLLWQSSTLVNGSVMLGCGGMMAWYAIRGEASAGGLLAFILLMGRVQWPFVNMSRTWGSVQESLGAADRVFGVLEMPMEPGMESAAGSGFGREGRPEQEPNEAPPALSLRGVQLCHPGADGEPLFRGLDLTVAAGETVAVVGPSGSGKTTLARLACGLYEPDAGTVEVAGIPLSSRREEARSKLTYVPQSPYLFTGSVRDNIAFGSEQASDEDIREAARLAGADAFIERLPEGYETPLSESGSNLSGGQRQRLAIARAFLRQAPLLILDEATSALDNESEERVQESLLPLMRGRSTLVIAHRLSTVRGASRIVVLDRGSVVESGTHEALLAQGGLYARLYALQFAGSGGESASSETVPDDGLCPQAAG